MLTNESYNNINLNQITDDIAQKMSVESSKIMPFVDYIDLMSNLLTLFGHPGSRLLTAGQVTAEVSQAADRSQMDLEERLSKSPFSGDPQAVISGITSNSDLIYIANPNRISGATYSLSNLKEMANAVPEGALIVDEYYFDYYGVTALPLIETHSNVIILRSFTAAFSITSADIGLVLASPSTIDKIQQGYSGSVFSKALCRTIESVLSNEEAVSSRMNEVRQESLRIAQALDDCGLFCRVTPTDFLLMRVADPTSFGNALASSKINIENLHGYPQMKNYVRYILESPLNNDNLIRIIQQINPDYFRMKQPDNRRAKTHQAKESVVPTSAQNRLKSVIESGSTNRVQELVENK